MDLRLVYVNKLGYNFKGNANYEFIFVDNDKIDINDVWGEGWYEDTAWENACPPDEMYVSAIGRLDVKDYELECASDSMYFSYYDAKDKVIALAYELIDDQFVKYPRLCFHYGDELYDVINKLKLRKLTLDISTEFDDNLDD